MSIRKRLLAILALLAPLAPAATASAQLMLTQQSTAYTFTLPDLVSATDHVTGLTGQTGTVYLTRVTGSSGAVTKAASTNSVSEVDSTNAPGQYNITLTSTETGALGFIHGYYKSSGSDPMSFVIRVVAYNPDSATNLGLSALPTAAPAASGGLLTVGTGSGQINAASGAAPATLSGTQTFAMVGNVTGNLSGSVGSVTAPVTAGTVSDKAGYALTTAPPTASAISTAILTDTTSGDLATAGSVGFIVKQLGLMLNGTPAFTAPALANAPTGSGGGSSITLPSGTVTGTPTTTAFSFTVANLGGGIASNDLNNRRILYSSGSKQGFITDGGTYAISGTTVTVTFAAAQKQAPATGDVVTIIGF